jgi:nitronate monooxygenase
MIRTRFTDLVDCTVPIQVAPMGGISTVELISATTAAGAFGMIGTAGMSVEVVQSVLDVLDAQGTKPIGANILMPFLDIAVVDALASRVKVVDFYHGDPDTKLVEIAHGGGALAAWQVGSRAEAEAAVDAGCDLIAVRGVEGGGRMHGDQPLWPLLNAILDTVDVPVLAAGGIATSRDIAAALAAGCDGVRMGTRFVATNESGAHPVYKQALVAAGPNDTVLIDDFSVLWPPGPQPHRVLRRALEAARAVEGDTVGEAMLFGELRPMPKFAVPPPTADMTGNIEAFAMYAGTSVAGIDRIEPAGELIGRLIAGAEELLARTTGP